MLTQRPKYEKDNNQAWTKLFPCLCLSSSWMRESSINYMYPTGWCILILTLILQVFEVLCSLPAGWSSGRWVNSLASWKSLCNCYPCKTFQNPKCYSTICHSLCSSILFFMRSCVPSCTHSTYLAPFVLI